MQTAKQTANKNIKLQLGLQVHEPATKTLTKHEWQPLM